MGSSTWRRMVQPPRNKVLRVQTSGGEFSLVKEPPIAIQNPVDPNESFVEAGNDIILLVPLYKTNTGLEQYVEIRLTDFNYQEFAHIRTVIATAFKEAEPIIRLRDADAKKALETGRIASTRAYRNLPILFGPRGQIAEHDS